ncbi:MAG: terpene cyclase/mutase family protein [Lentisphaeria bacterium]|nr:terpene cyclase/mutase family protein [Lentisphaeria bacterium]
MDRCRDRAGIDRRRRLLRPELDNRNADRYVPADTAAVKDQAEAALKIDSANREALALKNEAETHLVPTLQITPTVDGASVPATVKIGADTWSAGDTIRDLTGAYNARSGEGRAKALKAGGGGDNTERAVIRALDWLVKVQNDDGSWGDWQDDYNQKVQLTCLALLAMLAHGETPESERYGEALNKGLKLVLSWAKGVGPKRGSGWGKHEAGEDENGNIQYKSNDWYAMSRIAIVLAEGYAITKDPALKEGMDRVVTRLINEMNPSGGFGWHWDERLEKNIDYFSLDGGSRLYNALYSAYNAGCEVSGKDYNGKTVTIKDAIDRAISAISKRHACAEGGFSYRVQNGSKTYPAGFDSTGVGTFYLLLLGYNGNAVQKGYEWLLRHRPNGKDNSELKMDWTNLPSQTSALGWYYMTQALFQATGGQGAEWRRWNRQMTTALIKEQSREGYWECPADKYKQWEVVNEKQKNGKTKQVKRLKQYNESKLGGFTEHNSRIWATVYFTLTLEVYYRYLPTFKEDGTRNKEADIANDKKEASSAENADGGGEVLTDDQDADIML